LRKRILINGSILSDKKIGVEVYTLEVFKRLIPMLKNDNYEIDLFLYDLSKVWEIYHLNVKKIKTNKIIDYLLIRFKSIHRVMWNTLWLPRIAGNYDVVYSPSTHGGFNLDNQIITLHDLISLKFPSNNKIQYLYFKYFVPKILKKSKIIAISNFTRNDILLNFNLDKKNIITVYNGCNHLTYNIQSLSIPFDYDKYFLSVGLSLPHKNVENLLLAISLLDKPDYKFIIIARNTDYIIKMKTKVQHLNLNNVIFLSNVSDEELSFLYSNCIANIYLSLYEGFGLPPLEAAAFNKISIISNNSSLEEIYQNFALMANPFDCNDIKDKIEDVISGNLNDKLKSIDFNVLLNKYTWEKCSLNIFKLLTKKSYFE
jgi:glycosyltransferase involved in cell wall biosynthesis